MFSTILSNIAIRRGAQNMSTASLRSERGDQVEWAPSDMTSEDTYEMSDDDLVSKKTGAQMLVGPTSTRYEGSTNVFIGVVVVAVAVVVAASCFVYPESDK